MRQTIIDLVESYGGPMLLALFGASLQCLRAPWRGWKNFLLSNAMAAFSCIICMSVLPHYMPYDVAAAIAGIAGYSGGTLIDAILDRVIRDIQTRDAK